MKPVLLTFLLVAGLVALLAAMVLGLGVAEPLVPDPENVSNAFIDALSSGRYDIARQELSDELKLQVSAEELEQLDEELKRRFGRYEPQPGGQTNRSGDQATYEAQVQATSGERLQAAFELELRPEHP